MISEINLKFWLPRAAVIALVLGTFLTAWGFLRVEVLIQVDGSAPQTHSVWARTVRGALRAAAVPWGPEDRIVPAVDVPLIPGMRIEIQRNLPIRIYLPSAELDLATAERIPANILAEAGLALFAGDQLVANGIPLAPDQPLVAAVFHTLELRPAVAIEINANGDEKILEVAGPTLGDALTAAGYKLVAADHLEPDPATLVAEYASIQLLSAQSLNVTVDGEEIAVLTAGETVAAALARAGLPLIGLDYSVPDAGAPLPEDGQVRIVRVREEVALEQNLVPFTTELQPMPEVDIDTLEIIQPGEFGLEAQRVRIRYEDGGEISRTVEDNWMAREPVTRIQGYGTKITVRTLSTADGVIEYWRAVEFWATSYSPANSGTSPDLPWYGHVYCGGLMKNGFVGVDLSVVPCGTPLYIPGYGFAVAMDTGAISGAWIDLGYLDADYVPWHQNVTVYFLTPVPDPANIAWIIPPPSRR